MKEKTKVVTEMKYMVAVKFAGKTRFVSVGVLDLGEDALLVQEKYVTTYGKDRVIIVEM